MVLTRLSVSVLNLFLNIGVIAVCWIAGEVSIYALLKLTQLRLRKTGRAPLLHEADGCLRRLAQGLKRARTAKSAPMLLVVLLSTCLMLTELLSEVGVGSSDRCTPTHLKTTGICSDPSARNITGKQIAIMFYTQQVTWDDTELVQNPIRQGFRKTFNGKESFYNPSQNSTLPIVVGGCSVEDIKLIKPYDVSLTFTPTSGAWAAILSQAEIGNNSVIRSGRGDATYNDNYSSSFLFTQGKSTNDSLEVSVLEYADTFTIMNTVYKEMYTPAMNGLRPTSVTLRNRIPAINYEISCEKVGLRASDFLDGLQAYRSIQLESTVKVHPLINITLDGEGPFAIPRPLRASDVIRAVIALKAADPQLCDGETFVYTTCGSYDMRYIYPLLFLTGAIMAISVLAAVAVHRSDAAVEIPFTASSWSRFASRLTSTGTDGEKVWKEPMYELNSDETGRLSVFLYNGADGSAVGKR